METHVWEHPEYGLCFITWKDGEPVAVEFDLFTPPEEQEVLLGELRAWTEQVGPGWGQRQPTSPK